MSVVVIGSANMDLVINVPRIPRIGETIIGNRSAIFFGGKGANQAVAASRTGSDVCFICKLGQDVFGERIRTHLLQEQMPEDYILIDRENPTGLAQIWVSEGGENSIVVAPGANMNLVIEDILPFRQIIANAEVVLLQLEIPLDTVLFIIELCHKSSTKIILNPAPAQDLPSTILPKISILTPNESEAEQMTGIAVTDLESAHLAGVKLIEQGIKCVIVTLGQKGSLLCSPQVVKHFSSFRVRALDTTAAGDVFNGVLASSLSVNQTMEEAIVRASAAAAISVSRPGAQSSAPLGEEINKFLQHKDVS